VFSSLMIERLVGRGCELSSASAAAVRRIVYRAVLGFFTNIRRSACPYFSFRWLRTCLSRRRVVRLCALKQAVRQLFISGDRVPSSSGSSSS
jgi:hypothetical protein